jgi:hypothetical protein
LNVTAEQVGEASEKYLIEPSKKGLTSEAVLGEITESIERDPSWEKFDFDLSISEEGDATAAAVSEAVPA